MALTLFFVLAWLLVIVSLAKRRSYTDDEWFFLKHQGPIRRDKTSCDRMSSRLPLP